MSETVDVLRKAGIVATDYKRGPFGKDPFCISIQPDKKLGIVKYWNGIADVDVVANKRHHQAILDVQEHGRNIPRKVQWRQWGKANPRQIEIAAIREFNNKVNLPNIAKYTVTLLHETELNFSPERNLHGEMVKEYMYYCTVEARVRGSHQQLLVGIDEKYHFIAALPRGAQSVEEAHRILRPPRLSKKAIRQGEWFFTPVSPARSAKLDDMARRGLVQSLLLENFSSHRALQTIRLDGESYVVGYVTDDRATHHDSLYLDNWHKVVRNREVVLSVSQAPRRRTWD